MIEAIERTLHALWLGDPRASLRDEDRKKARELAGLLTEIDHVIDRTTRSRALTIVEAAAGKGYVSLLAHAMLPRARTARLVAIEREPSRVAAIREAARIAGATIDAIATDVADPTAWPERPDLAIALHACGDASDRVIERATERDARWILIAPCCVASSLPASRRADAHCDSLGLPASGVLRRGLIESWVMSERTLELEARGFRTEVVSFCAPTVTPYHLLLRAERVHEPTRMQRAAHALASLRGHSPSRNPST